MLKCKLFESSGRKVKDYLFSNFEELYFDLLDDGIIDNLDEEPIISCLLDENEIDRNLWNEYLNNLTINETDTDYLNDFNNFLKSQNKTKTIDQLTDQDYYNIIEDNLYCYRLEYYYMFVGAYPEVFYKINDFIIKFFNESGENIIEQLIFVNCDYLNKLDYRRKEIFFKLFNEYMAECNYSLDRILKILKVTKNKMINTDDNTFIYLNDGDWCYQYLSFEEFQKLEVNNDDLGIWVEGAYFIEGSIEDVKYNNTPIITFIEDSENVKYIDAVIENKITEKEPFDASYYLEDNKDAYEWTLLYEEYLNNIEDTLSDYQDIDFDISKILDIL